MPTSNGRASPSSNGRGEAVYSNGSRTSPRMDKGKGRAVDADEGAEQAYDESLRAALGDDGGDDSSTAGPDAGDGAQDDEGTFIYNGLDDEDTQEFIKDASLKHRSYQERLRGVLEGDESEHGEGGDAVAGQAPFTSPEILVHDPPSSPRPTVPDRSMTPTSPSMSSEADFSMSQASFTPPRSNRQRYLPPRRPPMNPLVSRLRSSSGFSTMSPSTSFRSISHSSSINSLRDIDGLNGFANSSPNSSFLAESGRDRMLNGLDSRSSINGNFLSPADGSEAARSESGQTEAGQIRLPPDASIGTSQPVNEPQKPTSPIVEPFKWTVLGRLSKVLHSTKATDRIVGGELGDVTAMAASGYVCVGTSSGWVLVFDYSQSLQCICGNEEIAGSAGKVTSLALSSDQTFVAVGHVTGFIYLYAFGKPQVPARIVPPVSLAAVQQGKAEGHLAAAAGSSKSAIIQLGFVGSRHTAIVSADSNGLAFYHSLGKVLGLANTDVLRILGRYPQDLLGSGLDASPILAMQALPLGTQAHPTDEYCLVAILTPAKLVVAGLKPSAKTWWRALNPKHPAGKVANGHASESIFGALAWIPSIEGEDPRLAYTWDEALHIVRVRFETNRVQQTDRVNGQKQAKEVISKSLRFQEDGMSQKDSGDTGKKVETQGLVASGAISALQWYNHRTLACMSPEAIEVFDMVALRRVERTNFEGPDFSQARHLPAQQSMRIYKSRLFLMCQNQLRVGTLLSWTDRILTLVDKGRFVQAIELALAFYDGTALSSDGSLASKNSLLGLPADSEKRKAVVGPKLQEVLAASITYVFSEDRMRDDTHVDFSGQHRGVDRTSLFETLVDVTVKAALAIDNLSLLFEDLYERYSAEGITGIFLDRLEPFVLRDLVRSPPVHISQQLLQRHEERGELAETEILIWHLEPTCLDIDQAIGLCTRHGLFDALVYVYTKALCDFVGPFVALFDVLRQVHHTRSAEMNGDPVDQPRLGLLNGATDGGALHEEKANIVAYKTYGYLADSLSGLSHPSKEPLSESEALEAKVSLYSFVFSGRARPYPDRSSKVVTTQVLGEPEPTYPYLRLLLAFDAESMLGCLDIAFEDPYLNEEASGRTPDRQQMMLILLEVMRAASDSKQHTYFTHADRTTLNIFIARNLPKYSQFIQLAEPTLYAVLLDLITDEDMTSSEDRQLAAEFLVSAFTPAYDQDLLAKLEQAHFYRILASVYRSRKAWRKLAEVQISDRRGDPSIFSLLQVTLSTLRTSERQEVAEAVITAADELADLSAQDLAAYIDRNFPSEHLRALNALESQPHSALLYMSELLEPQTDTSTPSSHLTDAQKLQYIALLCQEEPHRVVSYLGKDTHLPETDVMATLRNHQAYSALVWYLASKGRVQESLSMTQATLSEAMETLSTSMAVGAVGSPDSIMQILYVTRAAITVCCEQSRSSRTAVVEENWFALLSSVLQTVETASAIVKMSDQQRVREDLQPVFGLTGEILAALTASSASQKVPFSRLVRRLMDQGKTNTYVQYKDIIGSMLGTYNYEYDLLKRCRSLTSDEVFEAVAEVEGERRKGWRPNVTGLCEACGKPVFTIPSATESAFSPNLVVKSSSSLEVSEKLRARPNVRRRPSLKGKEPSWIEDSPVQTLQDTSAKNVVVFRGGAICHATCLQ